MLEAGLIVSRFLHFTAVLVLFGASLFPLYAFPDRADFWSMRSEHWVHRVMLWAALVALLSSLPWLAFTTANMVGTSSAAADWDSLRSVLRDTAFGYVWLVRLVLVSLAVGLIGLRSYSALHGRVVLALLTASLLAGLAGIGHTQQSEGIGGIIHVGADALHLLAAGAWIGGLLVLGYILAYDHEDAEPVLMRFSSMGYVAVAVLVASGLINGWYLVGSLNGLVGTSYGQLLLVKLCLFAGMLCLAITNRFWLVPSLRGVDEAGRVLSLARLRRHVVAEWTLGLLVVLIVSVLGTMEPASP
jgi:putative copper resistance protein D